jgi:hypothetical protein
MKLTPSRTVPLFVLLVLECCFLFAAFTGAHLDKPGAGSAWYEWHQRPSPETQAAWLAERRKIRTAEAAIDAVIWLLIVATGAGVYYVGRGQNRQI